MLQASGMGARVDTSIAINLIASNKYPTWTSAAFSSEKRLELVLSGGDEACTAPASARAAVQAASVQAQTRVTRIGCIEAEAGIRLVDADEAPVQGAFRSFDHFG
ncbi:hypothetical protein MMF98_22870 [Variovorax sp. CYS-02]|uniref:Uncharacterized protein n=1 Tax=Variovorax terrae TaxID=2923278 RepID=A0A9X2APR5_9BURK|nr:hypothetical protein [Variovorax terrae]